MSLARAKSRHTLQTCYRGYQAFEAAQKEREKTNVWVKLHHIALLCGVLSSRQEVGSTASTEIQAALKAWFRAAESVKNLLSTGCGCAFKAERCAVVRPCPQLRLQRLGIHEINESMLKRSSAR